jgi:abnormal spindle-like microcephaly-associated protein
MPLLLDATPCPGGLGTSFPPARRSSYSRYSISEDDTVATIDVDFTTEFRAQSRAVPPRRGRLGAARRPTTFAILEDREASNNSSPVKKSAKGSKQIRGYGTILSQPAQRLRPSQRAPSDARISAEPASGSQDGAVALADNALNFPPPKSSNLHGDRPRRRGTVYIPSEDTTIPSVFLGIFSPIKSEAQLQADSEALGRIEIEIVKKKLPRKSLAAAPRRAPLPLQPTLRPVQEIVAHQDVDSGRPGKENIPPSQKLKGERDGYDKESIKLTEIEVRSSFKHRRVSTLDSDVASVDVHVSGGGSRPKPAGKAKGPDSTSIHGSAHSSGAPKRVKPVLKKTKTTPNSNEPRPTGVPYPELPTLGQRHRLPSQSTDSRVSLPASRHQYPLLTQDTEFCHLYEDNWLDHQESAYTQLINHLLRSTNTIYATEASLLAQTSLRQHALHDYHTPLFSELYQRAKASIEHGALALPKESREGVRLEKDVGQKRKFLDLWLDSYDTTALGTAVEVIMGRICSRSEGSNSFSKDTKSDRRLLEDFLTTFLIRNEDKPLDQNEQNHAATDSDGDGWRHTHTTLRSLMLILLLDRVKETSGVFSGCLFKCSSAHKSSADVLRALKDILLPSLGDISRHLSHLGYELQHLQSPIDEYDYKIDNLATDLRDGVCLARLVEILKLNAIGEDNSFRNGLLAPTDPSWLKGSQDLPLSKQLKFPAISKTTQLFNVQLSLDNMSQNAAVKDTISGIRAEDIVNGHREKTLTLLWALVGKYGLPSLVDMEDVKGEITRFTKSVDYKLNTNFLLENVENSSEACTVLLREWAGSLARLRGIFIDNLTTDFAGQTGYRIFEAIVDEYEQYLPVEGKAGRQDKVMGGLKERLQALGCSSQFGLFSCSYLPLISGC